MKSLVIKVLQEALEEGRENSAWLPEHIATLRKTDAPQWQIEQAERWLAAYQEREVQILEVLGSEQKERG